MRHILVTGASILALGCAPAFAQTSTQGADTSQTRSGAAGERPDGGEATSRDAINDSSADADASASFAEKSSGAMPFPAPLVGDGDMEPHGTPFPSGYPESQEVGPGARPGVEPGEEIPPKMESYQGPQMWEPDGARDVDSDTGPSTLAEKRGRSGRADGLSNEEGPAFAWDGLDESVPAIRGQQYPDPDPEAAASRSDQRNGGGSSGGREARDGAQPGAKGAVAEHRLRLARSAQQSARRAVPEARFTTYDFQVENGRRVIEVAGTDTSNGRRVEVDVFANGRIESISYAITLDDVPEDIRSAVREELGRFRVAHARRSIMSDFDVYYEFAGIAQSGRPATAAIRADGSDLSVRYLRRR